MALFHIAPTPQAMAHLLSEGGERGRIFLLGNTVEDALKLLLPSRPPKGKNILFTLHRREHSEEEMRAILSAVPMILDRFPSHSVLYPVHPSPRVRRMAETVLGKVPRVSLVDPMEIQPFYQALASAPLVLTDSGGVQEEAALLGVKTLVLRENTERESELLGGNIVLGGTDPARIATLAERLLLSSHVKEKESRHGSPSELICKVLLSFKANGSDMPPLFRESLRS